MAKIIYDKGNREESIPFVALLDVQELFEIPNVLCEGAQKKIKKYPYKDKYVLIQGKSCFKEIPSFYDKLASLIKNEWISEKDKLMVVVFFEYLNSGTSKAILDLFLDVAKTFPDCSILWLVEEDDEEIYEQGQLIGQIVEKKNFFVEEVVLM